MPLTTKNSPLVDGAEFDLKHGRLDAKAGQLRVVRAFCLHGERVEVGEIVNGITPAVAAELITAGKVVREPVAAKPEKAADDSKPAKSPKAD